MKQVFFVLFCSIFCTTACIAQENPTDTRILNLEKQWMKALVDNDTDFIKQLYHPDITYVHASAQVDNKTVFINNMKTGALQYVSITPSEMHVKRFGKTAIVTYRAVFKAIRNGQPIELDNQGMDVYCRFGKKWQMVAHQTTKNK
jgi:ketosteroid isomerase-like protein